MTDEMFRCDRLPGGCHLTKAACGARHVEARRIVRRHRDGHEHKTVMTNPRVCAECSIGAENAGRPLQTREQTWKWPDLLPGTVVAGWRIVDHPKPYRYAGVTHIYVERVIDGYRRSYQLDRIRSWKRGEMAGSQWTADDEITANGITRTIRDHAAYIGHRAELVLARLRRGEDPVSACTRPAQRREVA